MVIIIIIIVVIIIIIIIIIDIIIIVIMIIWLNHWCYWMISTVTKFFNSTEHQTIYPHKFGG